LHTHTNHIAGKPVPAQSGEWLTHVAPATGQIDARLPRSQAVDVASAVEAASNAASDWAERPASERADLCEAVAELLEYRSHEFARLESEDTGKPITLAKNMDILRAIANFRFFAGAVRHDETGAHEMHGALNFTLRRPIGVVGLITPWNLPLYLLSWKVAPAIAMGNAVIAKPSEFTPATATALAAVFREIGAPDGIFNVIHGLGAEAGQAIVEHPGIRAISFTGGTSTGARVAATAAPLFKKCSLELGGKNATLVFADADFDAALEGAVRAAFTNQGQICLCGSRILVERSIYTKFTEAFLAKTQTLRLGEPSDPDTQVGALISDAHRQKVLDYLELARTEGGTIHGGQVPARPGWFLEPAVVTDLSPSCRATTEEIFGPVVSIHPFDTESEALSIANGVRYGLSASVWTQDLARAHRVSTRLEVGMVWVNTWLLRDLRVPFGGVKDSGVGREGGRHSLEFFSESRNVCIRWK